MKKYNKKKWKQLSPPWQVGKDGFGWLDVKYDEDGWAEAKLYKPFPYDLVQLKTERASKPGWWTGQAWRGFRIDRSDIVLFWKHENEGRQNER